MNNIVSLSSQKLDKISIIGTKALNLNKLINLGFNVPKGFCITSEIYNEHFNKSGMNKIEILQKISSSPDEKSNILNNIRDKIISSPLNGNLRKEIEKHFHLLGSNSVAVRSSCTAEDLEKNSFAGQYDTFLGISNIEDCILSIKKCWASLWNERVFHYREKYKVNHLEVSMAVIVQTLIEPNFSGVIFTIEPVKGEKDRIVIEYCRGPGESLVSGKITPERIIIDKKNLKIIEETKREIPEEIVKKLAEDSLKIEEHFNSPQDIEWAIKNEEIYFLQSRPVSTFDREDNFIWTNANTGEVLPDVATPVTWSIARLFIKEIFRQILTMTGIELDNTEIIKLIAGRIYFNLNVVTGIFKAVPGLKDREFSDILGGMQGKKIEGLPEILPEDIVTFKINPWKVLFKLPFLLVWFLRNSPSKGFYFIDKLRKDTDFLIKKDLSSMTDEELFRHFHNIMEKFYDLAKLVSCAGSGMSYFNILKNICRLWLSDSDSSISNRLMSGMGNMESALSGLDLWRLSLSGCENEEIKNIIMSEHNSEEIRESLKKIPCGREFLSKWNDFMKSHGHHTRGEIELFNKRWAEEPDYILDRVRFFMAQKEICNPVAEYEKRAEERDFLVKKIRKSFKNPFKRYIFNYVLLQASSGLVFRENIKSEAVKRIFLCRLILLEAGQRLHRKGRIENKEDIFFLELEELDSLFKDSFNNVRNIINKRRYEYEKNLKINVPPVIKGRFIPEDFISEEIKFSGKLLRGIAVSPGTVTGAARVILKHDREEKILPGEILVAPFTDPGWTPYFMSASAIVMDMGGMLSHGSIVARELAIPAVVNVGPATKIIKTGQIIRVDGNNGTVEIVKGNQ
jgi:pyruvate,water dikinase